MHEIPQQTGRVTELIYTYHTIALAAGFILDLIFGDPRWLYHPVCLIGKLISSFEKGIRKVFPKTEKGELAGGLVEVILICVITLLVPAFVLYFLYIQILLNKSNDIYIYFNSITFYSFFTKVFLVEKRYILFLSKDFNVSHG